MAENGKSSGGPEPSAGENSASSGVNTFANDGSFLAMFQKKMEEQKKRKEEAERRQDGGEDDTSAAATTQHAQEQAWLPQHRTASYRLQRKASYSASFTASGGTTSVFGRDTLGGGHHLQPAAIGRSDPLSGRYLGRYGIPPNQSITDIRSGGRRQPSAVVAGLCWSYTSAPYLRNAIMTVIETMMQLGKVGKRKGPILKTGVVKKKKPSGEKICDAVADFPEVGNVMT
ncbi:hypothetical protein Bbelb_360360 [Branchiostoma belcheri]|nr:hypothetical protein Bbelb_360360 [Branchiostoma belcheri]